MADPFDVTNNDYQPVNAQPGDVSPDFYHNLMAFGLATMAAGAQPGAQLAGALGQGGLAAMQSARENSNARLSQQAVTQNIQSSKLDNAMKLNNINGLRQLQGLPPITADGVVSVQPSGAQNAMPSASGPQSSAPPGAAGLPNGVPGGPAPAQNFSASPSAPSGSGPGIAPPGSSAGPTWTPSAGISTPNPSPAAYPQGPTAPAPGSTVGGIPTDLYNQLTPTEQQYVHTGMLYNLYGQPAIGKEMMDTGLARVQAEAAAKGKQPYDSSRYMSVTGADRVSTVFDTMTQKPVFEGAQEQIVPPGQPGAGSTYRIPPRPLPAGSDMSDAGQQGGNGNLNAAAVNAAQNAGAAPEPISPLVSPGGNAGIELPGPPPPENGSPEQLAANLPGARRGAAPLPMPAASSRPGPTQVASNNGIPPGSVMTAMSPQQHELLSGGAKDLIDKQQPLYETANQALASSAIIDQDMRGLQNSGLLSMGAGAQARLDIAKHINSMQQVMGVQDQSLMFDPAKVADAEGFNKEALRLGFADARSLGAREGQQVVEQSIKANPGLQSSQLGGQMLNSIIAEKAQRQKDLFEYKQQQLQQGIDPLQAETDFNKQYSGINYVRRAMSQFAPITIAPNRPAALSGLLPGTRVRLSTEPATAPGKVIPLTPGYQFSLPPTIHSLEQQGGQ